MATFKRAPFGEWNPFNKHIASDVEASDFVGSHTVLIASGPPKLSDVSKKLTQSSGDLSIGTLEDSGASTPVYPLGIVQSASVTQNKQLQRLFEIGSYRSYFIPGRTIGQINLGAVLFDGPSILRSVYAYYNAGPNQLEGQKDLITDSLGPNDTNERIDRWNALPGSNEEFYINLSSDLFNKPMGLLFYLTDNELQPYGAFYCEDCYTQGHNVSLNSGSVVIVEGISIQFDRMVPVKISIDENNESKQRSPQDAE